jgi:hypothetical protein
MPLARARPLPAAGQPERLCFWFGDPIDSARFTGRHDNTAPHVFAILKAGRPWVARHERALPLIIDPRPDK